MRHWQLPAEENDGHYSPRCFHSMIFHRFPVPETNRYGRGKLALNEVAAMQGNVNSGLPLAEAWA